MQDEMNDLQYTKPEDPDILKVCRCKDCRFYNEYFVTCNRDEHGRGMLSIVNPYTDYCSYGERKDG